MQVQLVMFRSDGKRREFTLRKDVTIIGRATECDFQIPLPMVSRAHCQITVREDHVSVRDMGSSNGTYVNGQRVQESDLDAGDKLVIGPVTFTVVIDGEPASIDIVPSSGNARGPGELESGTVDVDAPEPQKPASVQKPAAAKAKAPGKAPLAPAAENKKETLEVVEEVVESPDAQLPVFDDPLSALQAMTRPKQNK